MRLFDRLFFGYMHYILLAVVIGVGVAAYSDYKSEKIVLIKSNWKCTETRAVTATVFSGKVAVPVVVDRCVKWEIK